MMLKKEKLKGYESPTVVFTSKELIDVILASGPLDVSDWDVVNWDVFDD